MAQLDLATFSSQILWLTIVLLIIYVVISIWILPALARQLKLRSKVVSIFRIEKERSRSIRKDEASILTNSLNLFQNIFGKIQQTASSITVNSELKNYNLIFFGPKIWISILKK